MMLADRRRHGRVPPWLRRVTIVWLAGLLVMLALIASLAFVWYERSETELRELREAEMYARVLEDQATRAFAAADTVLASLTDALGAPYLATDVDRLQALLKQAQQGTPVMRSVSLVDAAGYVVASSVGDNVGTRLSRALSILPAAGEPDRLGDLQGGRDLHDVGAERSDVARRSGRRFLTVARRLETVSDSTVFLVAVINTDHFANEFVRTLDDARRAAALFSIDGRLVSATETIRLPVGTALSSHRFFREFLPGRERGRYIGTGIDGGKVVTAFRTLRQLPLVVFVEYDYEGVRADLLVVIRHTAASFLAVASVILLMAGLALRNLRDYRAVQAMLDRSRERVIRSERDLRALVESVHEVIFRTDARWRIAFINGRWEQISGQPASAAIGMRLTDLCVPEDRPRVSAWLAELRTADSPEPLLMRLRDAAGAQRMLEVQMTAERDLLGELQSSAGLMVDVSERYQARQRLEAELNFSSRLIEANPTPMFVKDGGHRFVRVNQAWLDLMGLEENQVIGRTSADLFPDSPIHQYLDTRLDAGTTRLQYDNLLVRPGREPCDTVVTKVRFLDAAGQPAGIIGSIVDVTTFREAERSIRRSRDAAEEANRAKSDFIANISHELRTPLQSILGFSEIGRESVAQRDPVTAELFDDVLAGGRRMLALVNDLLDVAKLDSSFARIRLAPLELKALARGVLHEFDPLASARAVTMSLHEQQEGPLPVEADGFRLQQVLRNVLANALRFAPEGSVIDVSVGASDDEAVIEVRDRGPGIPPDELEKVFEAFVQSTRTRDGSGGTGLGLTICRKIINAHRGTIRASNAGDGGAVLRIGLPRLGASRSVPVSDSETATAPLADGPVAAGEAR